MWDGKKLNGLEKRLACYVKAKVDVDVEGYWQTGIRYQC